MRTDTFRVPLTQSKPQLSTLPLDLPGYDQLPISLLIDPRSSIPPMTLPKIQLLFCYQALVNTIDSLLTKRYTDFDGHTTTNCCHGMALLTWHLVQDAQECNLNTLKQQYQQSIQHLNQKDDTDTQLFPISYAPKSLLNLACLHLLHYTKESDPLKGGRTVTKKLKLLAPISINMCNHISHSLKKLFANWIANSYHSEYFSTLNQKIKVSNFNVSIWAKYIGPEFIRSDRRGLQYASNLFSTQVTLAYLSQSKAKIALINDIHTSCGRLADRYTRLFEGDGQGGFNVLPESAISALHLTSSEEPVFILGGCVYSDQIDKDSISLKMNPWLDQLATLMLACDVFYPQFFQVKDDPEFDSTPIVPEENHLNQLMESLKNHGTHVKNPSLYCATHIQLSSLDQFMKVAHNEDRAALPYFFIPSVQMN